MTKFKKLLAILVALALAASMLSMISIADDTDSVTVIDTQTSTGRLTILSGADFTDEDLYLYVNYEYTGDTSSSYIYYEPGAICNSSWTGIVNISSYNSCGGTFIISLADIAAEFENAGYDVSDGVILNFWGSSQGYASLVSAQLVDTGSDGIDDSDDDDTDPTDPAEEDTAIWTVTKDEWSDNGNIASFSFTPSDYCDNADEIVSGDNITINVTMESDGTYFQGSIGLNAVDESVEKGYSWTTAGTIESNASSDVWTYTVDVASDYAEVQLWWIGSSCTYVSVTDISVTVNTANDEPTEPTTYAVTVDAIENGTVTADVSEAEAGDTVTLTVTPDEGYEVSGVTVTDASGNEVTVADDYTFTMPESDVTVSVVFEEESGDEGVEYTLISAEVDYDSSTSGEVVYTITIPAYSIYSYLSSGDYFIFGLPSSLAVDGTTLSIDYMLTMNGVTVQLLGSDGTESGVYEQTVNVGYFVMDYNSVSGAATVLAASTASDSIVITATVDYSGYDLNSVMTADDFITAYESLIYIEYYSEDTIVSAVKLSWAEDEETYAVTIDATENGTVIADVSEAEAGDTVTLTVTPDEGYEVSNVTVTDASGNEVTVADDYTFTMPESDVTVTASFVVTVCTHDYVSEVITEATCTENGVITYTCSICGESYTEETEATGHSYEEVVTEPTCTESGYTTHTCSACGDSYTDSETEALGHSYTSEVVKEPTCTENGLVTYTCSRCGDTYSEETEATGHSYEATDSSATCTEGGYTTYTCSVCGDTYTDDETEALGHDYTSEVTTEATCTEAGVMTYTCSRCGDSYTEEIPATGHTEAEAVTENEVAATCTTDGSYDSVVYCSVCGEEISRETVTVDATGHTAAEAVVENEVAATCTTDGSYDSVVYCSVCGEEISRETVTVEATGHSYTSEVTTEATCTEAGVMTYTCSVCGDSYTEEIAATGHTAGTAVRENVVEATSTTEGSYDLVTYCTVCGEELSRETVIVPAKGTDMVSVWLRTPANYTEVNNAIAKANALNPDDYTNFSIVTDAIDAVNWNYNALSQAYVTEMANAIETAIANLIPVSATVEDIEISEPIEPTDTETEDDGENTASETPVAESNPTTGVALSLIPMAIAALAAVSAKRR